MGSSNADGGGAVLLPLTDPAWMSFVEGHPEATPFHHPAWANVLARSYRFESCGLALVAEDGEIEAALPLIRLGGRASRRRAVSLPFTDWCPPLLAPGTDASILGERLEHVRRQAGLASLEVRDRLEGDAGFAVPQGHRHVLALQADHEAVFATFDSSRVRRKLRRAEREGVSVRRSNSERDLLDVFYPLHVATRRRLGVPVQPRRFFEVLGREYLGRGPGFRGHRPAAARRRSPRPCSSLGTGGCTTSSPPRTGRRPTSEPARPSSGMPCAGGVRTVIVEFDFGRTELGNEGLRVFKRAWGAVNET